MATLTLKRSGTRILTIPLDNLSGKYAVTRQSKNTKSMRFTCFHESHESAKKEAIRLQAEHITSRYLVLQVVGHVGE